MRGEKRQFRWGLLGTGGIASKFARALHATPGCQAYAVASRRLEAARDFAAAHHIPIAYGSYAELAADPAIDVVYVATPVTRHRDDCILALRQGKAVLCEKPFARDASEARDIAAAARAHRVFCMEGMWTRFIPAVRRARDILQQGALGDIRLMRAEFGIRQEGAENRLLDPKLGGGFLDLGVYPVSLAHYLLGPPQRVQAAATWHPRKIEDTVSVILHYPDALALVASSIGTTLANEIVLAGTQGRLTLHAPLFQPEALTQDAICASAPAKTHRTGWKQQLIDRAPWLGPTRLRVQALRQILRGRHYMPARTNGLRYEIEEVVQCLSTGATESALMSLDDSIAVMDSMDAIRGQLDRAGGEEVDRRL